ncbi:protein lin-37 homolog [Bombyx mandarina]|uniref:Protein lin-37 homolog n=1 Tax=Bombyx mandarina TaxID=7092 RepID=A0A6J2K191_BOMMA|nr:protein lin-37 homolog [Bombyx mandarina]
MRKRRRIFTPIKNKGKSITQFPQISNKVKEVTTARGRLQGALMEILEPALDSDDSTDLTPGKRRQSDQDETYVSEEEDIHSQKQSQRQSYVLKLFDRSVDLSQFDEDSPLYPICRAWIANQPKADYSKFGYDQPEDNEDIMTIDLPGPEGPPVSRIPELLPEQKAANKDNIDLEYTPPPSREQLLSSLQARWSAVREAWLQQSARAEARYEATQKILNKINVNST